MPSSAQFRGVYSIPVTPFNEDLSVDWKSLARCIEFCVEAGANGIVLPVNASEGPFLSDEERNRTVRTAVEVVDRAVPVIAGVTGGSIPHAVGLARSAAEAGADALMAAPPGGASTSFMVEYFTALAEATDLPFWIQNNKPPTSPTIPTSLIVRLLKEVPRIEFVKEESLLPGQVMTAIFEAAGDSVVGIMGGMGGRYLPDEYHRGACGTMPAGHITDAHAKLWTALERGGRDAQGLQIVTDEARGIWEQMLPSLNFEFMFGVNAYKMAFYKRGIISTPATRSPATKSLDRHDVEELLLILDRMAGLLDTPVPAGI